MKKKILQKVADVITNRLQRALDENDLETFQTLYGFALYMDTFCVLYLDVYLD